MTRLYKILLFLVGWLLAPFIRRRAVLLAARAHDLYAHKRMHVRKRPGFDADQRLVAIQQRAQRELHRTGARVALKHVKKILQEKS